MNATTTAIEFVVIGTPQPRGSKTAMPVYRKGGEIVLKNGRPVIRYVDANKKSGPWMNAVAKAARQVYAGPPLEGPVRLTVNLYFQRPKCHYGTGRNASVVKDSAPVKYHTQKPDRNKCIRAIEDALTGIAYLDDSQVVCTPGHKLWTHGKSRVEIRVEEIE